LAKATIAAETAGSRLPPLLIAADRVAATVAQGIHGRRRTGQGDSFWQFRRFVRGDLLTRVDWRQSAKSGREPPDGWFIRETEWEAAQSVCLWRDASPSMSWRSDLATVEKRQRADLLLLALASLLLRGGERVILLRHDAHPVMHRSGLDRLAVALEGMAGEIPTDLPLPRFGAVVLFSDFLSPLEDIRALMARFAGVPLTGYLMQILDPAEAALPFQGRIRFRGLEKDGDVLIPRSETVRDAYARRLQAHQQALRDICATAGFGFGVHPTNQTPEAALLTLYAALTKR